MNLKPIQQAELNLFETFIMICNQYSLHYFLIGGSLLGAIRHQGFIPWDDDLDIGMAREDYNKFLKLAPVLISHSAYFLQTPFTDKNYAMSYAKLIDLDTEIQEKNNYNNAKSGIFIDIFPFDAIPEKSSEQTAQMAKIKFYDSSIIVRLGYRLTDSALNRLFKPLTTRQYGDVRELKHKRDEVFQQYNQDNLPEYKNLASQYKYDKEIMSVEEMTNLTSHPFAHLNVMIPANYDAILSRLYGNYMELPPEGDRSPKHYTEVIINGKEILCELLRE